MSQKEMDRPDLLDLYLDGRLEGEELAAFEERLTRDQELAAEVDRHHAIESRLRIAFAPPADPAAIASAALGMAPMNSGRAVSWDPGRIGRLAAAALLLVSFGVAFGWWTGRGAGPGETPGVGAPPSFSSASRTSGFHCGKVYAQFEPKVKRVNMACSSENALATHFSGRYGQELYVRIRQDATVDGPYAVDDWPTLTILRGRAEEHPVLILADARASDPRPFVDPEGPLRLYRRDLGKLVLYEITPLDEPRCLDLFYVKAEAPILKAKETD